MEPYRNHSHRSLKVEEIPLPTLA